MSAEADIELPRLRIGALSSRTGIPVPTIRGWERRYGFPMPNRTETGYRLYCESDALALKEIQRRIASGLSASQAVSEVKRIADQGDLGKWTSEPDGHPSEAGHLPGQLTDDLVSSCLAFNAVRANMVLDQAFEMFGVAGTINSVALRALKIIGDKYVEGTATVSHEHFASNIIRGRLWSTARGWDSGVGPLAVLASVSGDQHDIALLALGILLHDAGWRIMWIGADTPSDELVGVCERVSPSHLILGMTANQPGADDRKLLSSISKSGVELHLAGSAANEKIAKQVGASFLPLPLVEAVQTLLSAN